MPLNSPLNLGFIDDLTAQQEQARVERERVQQLAAAQQQAQQQQAQQQAQQRAQQQQPGALAPGYTAPASPDMNAYLAPEPLAGTPALAPASSRQAPLVSGPVDPRQQAAQQQAAMQQHAQQSIASNPLLAQMANGYEMQRLALAQYQQQLEQQAHPRGGLDTLAPYIQNLAKSLGATTLRDVPYADPETDAATHAERMLAAKFKLGELEANNALGLLKAKRELAQKLYQVGGQIVGIDPDTHEPTVVWKGAQDALENFKVIGDSLIRIDPDTGRVSEAYRGANSPKLKSSFRQGDTVFGVYDNGSVTPLKTGIKAELTVPEQLQGAATLRDDFRQAMDPYLPGVQAYNRAASVADTYVNLTGQDTPAAQTQRAAADVALLTSFLKVLDPTSVARESEVAAAANARGLGATATALLEKAQTGEQLTDTQRRGYLKIMRDIRNDLEKRAQPVISQYESIASEAGIPAHWVTKQNRADGSADFFLPDSESFTKWMNPPPAVGTARPPGASDTDLIEVPGLDGAPR